MNLDCYRDQIAFARTHTNRLLDIIPEGLWFRMPAPGVTHIAWQVGHLAMAQYRLALERVRGIRPEDETLISSDFLKLFIRLSVANPDPAIYPPPREIRRVFDAVHERVLAEIPTFANLDLRLAPHTEHPLCKTREACLMWCSHHETLHAGQIGLLRRLFGEGPIW